MNLQLHHVISDITGATGLAIIDAILAGERDTEKLARRRDARIAASKETIARSLVGDYRPEHLFTLRQSLEAYRQYQQWIAACDGEIERLMQALPGNLADDQKPLSKPKDHHKPRRNELRFNLRYHLHRIFGVDLTEVLGSGAPGGLLLEVASATQRQGLGNISNASPVDSCLCLFKTRSSTQCKSSLIAQAVTKLGMSDCDKGFSALLQGFSAQIGYAIFGDHILHVVTRGGDCGADI
jgi:hypothetical protein